MNIGDLRKSKNLTQEELATMLGVTRSTVAMWETGEVLPRTDKLPALAKIFGCKIDELFNANAKV